MCRLLSLLLPLSFAAMTYAADAPQESRPRERKGPPPEGRELPPPPPGEGPGGPGEPGERHRPLPPPPFMQILDTDRDEELSAEEIDNASDALAKLDRNGDGKLDHHELRPPLPPRPEREGQGGRPPRPEGPPPVRKGDKGDGEKKKEF